MVHTQFGRKPKVIRSDRGGEYTGHNVSQFLKTNGIRMQYTAAYSPQQNGVAERKNRSLMEMARCMLLDAKLDFKFWAEAVSTANFMQNRLPSRVLESTPYQLWNGRKPNFNVFNRFGDAAYVHIPTDKRHKLQSKSKLMTFIGYDEHSKAYRMLDEKSCRVHVSRDVRFVGHTSENHQPEPENQVIVEEEPSVKDEDAQFIFKGGDIESSVQPIAHTDIENTV